MATDWPVNPLLVLQRVVADIVRFNILGHTIGLMSQRTKKRYFYARTKPIPGNLCQGHTAKNELAWELPRSRSSRLR